jgi:FkbM family methyltransferase
MPISLIEASVRDYRITALLPGEDGECWFHSQKPHEQDKAIFRRFGGTVGSCRDAPVLDIPSYSEAQLCTCTAPGVEAFGLHFMEIGANDGQYLSNSLFFELQMGWTGICIEASPSTFQSLRTNRPTCAKFNVLIGSDSLPQTFYTFVSPGSWETGVSCMRGTACAKQDEDAYNYARENSLELRIDEVQMMKLSQIFQISGFRQFAWLSVDVEGAEDYVISTIDFNDVRAAYVSFEGSHSLAQKHLTENGYVEVFQLGPDVFYSHA